MKKLFKVTAILTLFIFSIGVSLMVIPYVFDLLNFIYTNL
jgi:hypothetical protein